MPDKKPRTVYGIEDCKWKTLTHFGTKKEIKEIRFILQPPCLYETLVNLWCKRLRRTPTFPVNPLRSVCIFDCEPRKVCCTGFLQHGIQTILRTLLDRGAPNGYGRGSRAKLRYKYPNGLNSAYDQKRDEQKLNQYHHTFYKNRPCFVHIRSI